MEKERTYTYLRYMRDGSTREFTGIANDPRRVRVGKTAKARSRK
jgi:hypothetical protein